MKIAMPIWSLSQRRGGTERAGADLASALARRGHEVIIFTSGLGRLPALYPLHESVRLEYNLPQLRLWHEGLAELRRQVSAHAPDVLLGMGSDVTLLAHVAMVQGTGAALVLSDRSAPCATGGINWNQPDRLATFSAADRIHCLLPRYAQSFPPCLQGRIRHIPNATPLAAYADSAAQRQAQPTKILLTLGRLRDSIKQQSLLIAAFALLRPRFPHWQAHIWGGDFYGEKQRLEELVAHLGLQGSVLFMGESLDVSVPLRTAHILCHPSRYEGFPMSVVEGMRHSLPIVGFAQCEALHDVADASFARLAPHMTAESLAETLAPLMEDEALRDSLGAQALLTSNAYTLDAVVTQWEELLDDAVRAHRTRARPAAGPGLPCGLPKVHHGQIHTQVFIHVLQRSGMFDYTWYRAQYVRGPEVMDPLVHYVLFGAAKGYRPNAWFDTAAYRNHFLQGSSSGINPLLHYYMWGKAAGLSPAP